jgi:hypothetical protein
MIKVSTVLALSLVLASCSPDSPKLQPHPKLITEKVVKDNDYNVVDPKVDILFVVDNSGSMDTHQKNLSANVGRFISAFFNRVSIDYHIGVLSSDMDQSFTGKCCGRLIGTPSFIDTTTPTPTTELSSRLILGTNGSGTERMFDPVMAALSAPLDTTVNQGFLRSNAHLAVIFITDAEDQSTGAGLALYNYLVKLKGRREKVLAYGAIVPSGAPSECSRDEYGKEPRIIEQFLALPFNKGGNIFSLCSLDFGDKLAKVAEDLAKQVSNTIYLNRAPVLSTVKVFFGTQEIPSHPDFGWSYDANLNAIFLGDNLKLDENQPPGTKIRVDFEAASYVE